MTNYRENKRKSKIQGAEIDQVMKVVGRRDTAAIQELEKLSERIDTINATKAAIDIEKRVGFIAEEYHAGTLASSARKLGDMELQVETGNSGGFGIDPRIDIRATRGNKVIAEAQAKFGASHRRNAVDASKAKYHDTQLVVPSDQASTIKSELAASASRKAGSANPRMREIGKNRADASKRITDRVKAGKAESRPLKYKEAMKLANGDKAKLNRLILGQQAMASVKNGAKGGAIVGGTFSAISNGIAIFNGSKKGGEAVACIAEETARSTVKGATVALAAEGVKVAAKRAIPAKMAKSIIGGAGPLAVAGAGIEMAVDAFNGDLTPKRAAHHASTAAGGWAGAEAGAMAGSWLGPIGTVIGGIAGGIVGSIFAHCTISLSSFSHQ